MDIASLLQPRRAKALFDRGAAPGHDDARRRPQRRDHHRGPRGHRGRRDAPAAAAASASSAASPEGAGLVTVTEKAFVIGEKVQFDVNKATIKEVSHKLLDTVAEVMQKHPKIKKILVEGHASSDGNAAADPPALGRARELGHEVPRQQGRRRWPPAGEGLRRHAPDRGQQDGRRPREEPPRGVQHPRAGQVGEGDDHEDARNLRRRARRRGSHRLRKRAHPRAVRRRRARDARLQDPRHQGLLRRRDRARRAGDGLGHRALHDRPGARHDQRDGDRPAQARRASRQVRDGQHQGPHARPGRRGRGHRDVHTWEFTIGPPPAPPAIAPAPAG